MAPANVPGYAGGKVRELHVDFAAIYKIGPVGSGAVPARFRA